MSRLALPDERLPDGDYRLRILAAESARSRAGHPTLRVRFQVTTGPHAGHVFTAFYSLLPQARWRLRQLCAAAGLPELDGEIDTDRFANVRIDAAVSARVLPDGPPLYDLDARKPSDPDDNARS